MFLKVRNDTAGLQTVEPACLNVLEQCRSQGNSTGGDEVSSTITLAFAASRIRASTKNRHATDDIVLQGPIFRFRIELTIEDENSEGLVKTMLDDPDVDNPFSVLVVWSQVSKRFWDRS